MSFHQCTRVKDYDNCSEIIGLSTSSLNLKIIPVMLTKGCM